MRETPVGKIMEGTIDKLRQMVDVSTIVGEPIEAGGATIIPVSKVTYGFTSGGTDLPSKTNNEMFGGAGGGGVTIAPVAFIVIKGDSVRMMQVSNFTSSADRAISMIPELLEKVTELVSPKNNDAVEAAQSEISE